MTDAAVARALDWLDAHPEVDSIRAAVCDLNGIMRGKRLPVRQAREVMENGLRLPLSVMGLDVWGADIAGNPEVFDGGDADGVALWTGRAPLPVDWLAGPTAFLPLWHGHEDGSPCLTDPRRALAGVVDRYRALGLTPVTAVELEFHLVDPGADLPRGPRSPVTGRRLRDATADDLDQVDQFEAFFRDVHAACAAQGIVTDTTIAENGAGQFEINLVHASDPLRVADDAVFFKRVVKGVARRHGLAATFMAKPYGHSAGNGLHVHMSLADRTGRNVFDNDGPEGTAMMRHAIGGLLGAMRDCMLVFAPHLNSYRRLRPNAYAPVALTWGYENRMAAIRIPGGAPAARRIEHRVAGADANPYLVMAAILGAALDGITRETDPGPPHDTDGRDGELPRLPTGWVDAADAFAAGTTLPRLLPAELRAAYLACKRQEIEIFARRIDRFEYRSYRDIV